MARRSKVQAGGRGDASLIRLTPDRRRWVESQVAAGRFCDTHEAINHLVREAEKIEQARDRLDQLLLEGIASGPGREMTDKDWRQFRANARRRAAAGTSARTPRRKSA